MLVGIILGALPGVSGVLAITLMLGPSYYMQPLQAIILLSAIYTGSVYGGGITAILLNIPGSPAAIATGFDGYAMTRSGRHNEALGVGIMSSAFGCFMSYFVVLFIFLPLGKLVLKFGPAEMVMVVIFAMTSVGLVRGEVMITVITGLFGLLVGTIGASPYGHERGIFGQIALFEGIPLIPALLGMLAVSELFFILEKEYIADTKKRHKKDFSEIVKGMATAFHYKRILFRSSFLGMVIGLMPAAGSTIASMVSYGLTKRLSKNPESFGKGEPMGVIGAETANNGSEGGAVATMMLLGIPGSVSTALLLAAFMLHGLSPGPYLIRDNLDFAYAVILGNLLQAFVLIAVATIFVNYFKQIVYVPTRTLVPAILIFAVLGALAPRGLLVDVVIMIIFSVFGYVMKKLEFPIMGFLLGFILGGLMDREFLKAYLLFSDAPLELFHRPVFIVLLALNIAVVFWPQLSSRLKFSRRQQSTKT
jgi:putative tricarboxylic transport membrane protein